MKFIKRSELVLLILSLSLGFGGTCLYAEYAELPSPRRTEYAAWWGGLYPQYCLPGAIETKKASDGAAEVDKETEAGARAGEDYKAGGEAKAGKERVEIRFRYLKFLNP